jgi:hypothetical protein
LRLALAIGLTVLILLILLALSPLAFLPALAWLPPLTRLALLAIARFRFSGLSVRGVFRGSSLVRVIRAKHLQRIKRIDRGFGSGLTWPLISRPGWFPAIGVVLGDLLAQLPGKLLDLVAGALERGGLVAEDAPRGAFHSLAKLVEPRARALRRFERLLGDPRLGHPAGFFQVVRDRLLLGLADRVVQVLGEQRLGFLGLADGLLHPFEQVLKRGLLVFEVFLDLRTVVGVAE